MALVVRNRVQETGTANTTVSFTLNGAVTGFQSFASIGNNNTTYYTATDASGSWEVGLGTYSTSGPTLTRNTILASSNTGSAVTFSGDVNVFVTYPSDTAVYSNGTNLVGPTNIPLQVSNGGTGVIASSGANSVVLRDANGNITGVNNVEVELTLVTSAGGTTTLTAASTQIQILTGSANQTFKLPDATTLLAGTFYTLSNTSTGVLTVTDNANAVIETISQGGAAQVLCVSNATVAGTWGFRVFAASNVTWGNANLDYNGTITSAEWQGDTVQPAYGGTGLTTFTGANNALFSTGASTLTAGTLPILAGGTGATSLSGANIAVTNATNTFTANQVVSVTDNSNAALRITQLGTGNALLVEDDTNPDSTPFVVTAAGSVGIGISSPNDILDIQTPSSNYSIRIRASASNFALLRFVNNADNNTDAIFGTPAANTLAFYTNGFSERMRIDSSGNVGIGTTSPVSLLQVGSTATSDNALTVASANNTAAQINLLGDSSATVGMNVKYEGNGNFFAVSSNNAGSLTERMRINSSGELVVGSTSISGARVNISATAVGGRTLYLNKGTGDTTDFFIVADTTTANRFLVLGSGNVQNTNNSYGAISDIKLKENIVDATPKLEDLCKVKVRNYNLKGDYEQHKQIGVVAQELEQVFAGLVEETKDIDKDGNNLGTTTKAVKYSVFVPMLIKAVQELKAELDSVKAELQTLKGA